jgi:hypothetical protein
MGEEVSSPPSWRKSSKSGDSNCVEVSITGSAVLVRDSKARDEAVLEFTPSAWSDFISALQVPPQGLR